MRAQRACGGRPDCRRSRRRAEGGSVGWSAGLGAKGSDCCTARNSVSAGSKQNTPLERAARSLSSAARNKLVRQSEEPLLTEKWPPSRDMKNVCAPNDQAQPRRTCERSEHVRED